jgi:hypothetical protein
VEPSRFSYSSLSCSSDGRRERERERSQRPRRTRITPEGRDRVFLLCVYSHAPALMRADSVLELGSLGTRREYEVPRRVVCQ